MTDISAKTEIINRPDAPLPAKVAAAAELWTLIERCQESLEIFKQEVRKLAVTSGKTSVTFDGEGLTQAKVVVPGPSLKLIPGVTVESERDALGELFDAIYEVKLQLRKADPTFLATFPPNVRRHISTVTTLVTNPPRVSLKSLPGVSQVGG